jgi:hypothetical protein
MRKVLRMFPRSTRRALLHALLILSVFAGNAQAYVDPGTGSLLLQILAAGAVTAAVVFRRSISRILLLFRRAKK